MTKKRIRYSEFGAPPATSAADTPSRPVVPDTSRTEAPIEVSVPARPRRNSTPVELARALAAAQALEAAEAAKAADALAAAHDPAGAPTAVAPSTADLADVLVFRIGSERFAVDLLAVDEVIDLPVIHHVPEMPPAMVGVVTVRGALTAVYSPHQALGLSLVLSEAVLIFRRTGARVGILIDDVEDALSVDLRELRQAPGTGRDDTLVIGVIRHDGSLLAIVDADALIAACQSAALLETAWVA